MKVITNVGCNLKGFKSDFFDTIAFDSYENIARSDLLETEILIWNNNFNFPESFFSKFPKLKLFINWGTELSNLPPLEAFEKKDISVKCTLGYCTQSVSEFILLHILKNYRPSHTLGNELHQKKVGFIGFGKIAQNTSKILHDGFGCEIQYHCRTPKNSFPDYTFVSQKEIFETSDIIVIAVNPTNFELPLHLLKNSSQKPFIINVSRDNILPISQIHPLLQNGLIRGFVSDNKMNSVEPRFHEFYSGHIAYRTLEAQKNKFDLLRTFIKNYIQQDA